MGRRGRQRGVAPSARHRRLDQQADRQITIRLPAELARRVREATTDEQLVEMAAGDPVELERLREARDG
jgi:hypothetical protein